MKTLLSLLSVLALALLGTGCASTVNAIRPSQKVASEIGSVTALVGGQRVQAEVAVMAAGRTLVQGFTTPTKPFVFEVSRSEKNTVEVFGNHEGQVTSISFPRRLNAVVAGNAVAGFPGLAVGAIEGLTPYGKTHGIGEIVLSFNQPFTGMQSDAPATYQAPPVEQVRFVPQPIQPPTPTVVYVTNVVEKTVVIREAAPPAPTPVEPPRDTNLMYSLFGRAFVGRTAISTPAAK